jgi:DNA-binding response OmpR family regulator
MNEGSLESARILVVDDQEDNVVLLQRILAKAGYTNVSTTTDPREVLPRVLESEHDLIILDLLMPHLSGFDVIEQLSKVVPDGTYLPILVLTADLTQEAMHRALSIGARDFLHKPFDPIEVLLRIKNLLETRFMYLRLQDKGAEVERKVEERTRALHKDLERATELADRRRQLLSRLTGTDLADAAESGRGTR